MAFDLSRRPLLPPPRPPYPVWISLLAFVALAILMRWGSFFISVINHDESTYIVIADELLRGEVYLRDVVDTKPIGIFWLYAGLIKLTGGSIVALRLAAAVFVGIGAWLLGLTANRATGGKLAGYVAGTVYCLLCSVYTFYGVSPNTEIFFNVFTIAAVALAVAPRSRSRPRDPFWHWPVAGLLLGTGCIIKPFVAAEALAIGLFLIAFYRHRPRRDYRRLLAAGALLLAGFALPPLLVVVYYASLGLLPELYFYTVEVGRAYPVEIAWYLRLKYMGDYLLRFSPIIVWAIGSRISGFNLLSRNQLAMARFLRWEFLLVTVVILLTGKRFGHYQIQLHPVLALYTGLCVGTAWRYAKRPRVTIAMVVALAAALGLVHKLYYDGKEDRGAAIATYFDQHLREGEQVFGMGEQIVYHLIDRPVPVPYAHPSLMFHDPHIAALRVDTATLGPAIIDNPRIRYLYGPASDDQTAGSLRDTLMAHFFPLERVGSDYLIYRRKGD